MSSRLLLGLAAACAVLLLASQAAAEPVLPGEAPAQTYYRVRKPSTLHTLGGLVVPLPPVYILGEPEWERLDAEVRRLQDAETRLEAENTSLRETARALSFPWRGAVVGGLLGLVVGIAATVYASR